MLFHYERGNIEAHIRDYRVYEIRNLNSNISLISYFKYIVNFQMIVVFEIRQVRKLHTTHEGKELFNRVIIGML